MFRISSLPPSSVIRNSKSSPRQSETRHISEDFSCEKVVCTLCSKQLTPTGL